MNSAFRKPQLPDPDERVYRSPMDHPEVVEAAAALAEIDRRMKVEEDRVAAARSTLRARSLRRSMSEKGIGSKAKKLVSDLLAGGEIQTGDPSAIIESAETTLEILRPERWQRQRAYEVALSRASFINSREHADVDFAVLETIRHGMLMIQEGVGALAAKRAALLSAGNRVSGAAEAPLTAYALMADAALQEHDKMTTVFRANHERLKALGE